MYPKNISAHGGEVDHLFNLAFLLTGITLLLIVGIMLWILIVYRGRPGRRAHYSHGTSKGALILTAVVAVVVFVGLDVTLAIEDHHAYKIMYGTRPKDPVVVQVFAKQFEWHFRYVGTDGVFGTADDIYSLGELTVPLNKPVLLRMRSADVVHSLFLPYMRRKQDVLPGQTVELRFTATQTTEQARAERSDPNYHSEISTIAGWFRFRGENTERLDWFSVNKPEDDEDDHHSKKAPVSLLPDPKAFDFEIACAELCGANHARMRGVLTVRSEKKYEAWVAEQSKLAQSDEAPEINDIWIGWTIAPPVTTGSNAVEPKESS